MALGSISGWNVLVSGASGFIGSQLAQALARVGAEVRALVRRPARKDSEVSWDPSGAIDAGSFEGQEAVVHLAGEPITGRWTASKKWRILESRKQDTAQLAASLAQCRQKPRVLLCASAIGVYGDRGEELLHEESTSGTDFLSEVGRAWEAATAPAAQAGIRVVNLRIGIVLSPRGGALKQMLPPFKLGLGGRLGSGRQYMSWVALDDLLAAMQFALSEDSLLGPVNAVAPNPVTNAEFTRTLGRVLHRPTIFPVPAFAVRLLFGEMGQALLLSSQRVEPRRLLQAGFQFEHPELPGALAALL